MKTIFHITYALYVDNIPLEVYVADRELAERIAHKRNHMNFGEEDAEIKEISVCENFDELPKQLQKALAQDLLTQNRQEEA